MPSPNSPRQPGGLLLLWTGFAACVALALWQTGNAVFDYGQLEARKKVAKKLSAAGKAVVFAVIALTFAASASGNSQDQRTVHQRFHGLHHRQRPGVRSC